MAFSFKNALNSVVSAVKNFVAPPKQQPVKAPSTNFVNTVINPGKTLSQPKPRVSTPTVVPNYVLSSTQNPLTSNRSNPLTVNTPNISSSNNQGTNNFQKSVGQGIANLGTWIDTNVRSGSGNKVGEVINAVGNLAGYFKQGGTTLPGGKYSVVPTPKFDFSQALQNLGNKLVKKASASEYGLGSSSNTPTGSFIPKNDPSGLNISRPEPTKQQPYAIASLPDGRVKYSDGTIKNNDNPIYDKAKENYDKFSTDQVPTVDTGDGAYVALNDEVNNILKEYETGNMSIEEAQKRMADAQKAYLWAQYNTKKSEAESLIPQYESLRDQGISDVNAGLEEVKSTGAKSKETTINTYGDILRRSTENKRYRDAQRRNIFSALGTADSSTFIEEQQRADSAAGSDDNRTQREMADKVAGIDTEITKAEKSAKDRIMLIKDDAANKIAAVKRNTALSKEEVEAQIETIYSQLASDVVALAQDLQDKKAGLLSTQLQLSGNLQAIREQGNVDLATQKAAYNLQNQPNQIPADLQNELRGFVSAPSSSYSNTLKKQRLQAAYPAWADYIEQVMNPIG